MIILAVIGVFSLFAAEALDKNDIVDYNVTYRAFVYNYVKTAREAAERAGYLIGLPREKMLFILVDIVIQAV